MKTKSILNCLLPGAVSGLLMTGTVAAATVNVGGFTLGSTFADTISDRAATGAQDSSQFTGPVDFAMEYTGVWNVGDTVNLTGIAFPVRTTTAAGTLTVSFYDHNLGSDPLAFEGAATETLLGTSSANLADTLAAAGVLWWNFDEAINFTAASSGVTVHIASDNSIRFKIANVAQVTAGDGPINQRVSLADGTDLATNPTMKLSLAGVVTPIPEPSAMALGVLGQAGLLVARRRS